MQSPGLLRALAGVFIVVLAAALAPSCGPDPEKTAPGEQGSANPPQDPRKARFESLIADAVALAGAGRPIEARALFEEAAAYDRLDPRVQRGLRLAKVGPERAAAARASLEKAEDALFLGHDLEAWQHLAEARQLDPNDEGIESLYAGACLKTRRFQEAWGIFDAVYRSDPSRIDAYLGRAEAAYRAQDWDRLVEGLEDLESLLTAGRGNETLVERLPQLRFLRGVALYSLYRYPEAIATLEKAVAAAPTNPQFRDYLASSRLEGGDFEAAARDFEALIDLAPRSPLARYKRGKALDRLGRKREAIESYRAELGMYARQHMVAVDCARCYEALGGEENLRAAQVLLEDALELNPLSHDALFTLQSVHKKLGLKEEAAESNRRYLELARFKEAREEEMRVFERRRKNDPNDAEAWLAMINIKARYSQAEEVLDLTRKMVIALPRNVEALHHLAQLFLVLGEDEDAWHEAAKMMDFAPQDARGFAIGATALIRLNRHRDALPLARRALALDDNNGDALESLVTALQRLEPESSELATLMPLYEHMREQQKRLEEEMRKLRDPAELLNR